MAEAGCEAFELAARLLDDARGELEGGPPVLLGWTVTRAKIRMLKECASDIRALSADRRSGDLDAPQQNAAALSDLEKRFRELLEFDPTRFPSMEAVAIAIANRIAGPRGGPSSLPDPVQVLEDAAALVRAGLADMGLEL